MKPRLIVAALVRDEMHRFFPRALDAWTSFADIVVVLDDGSTDGSREHAAAREGVHVVSMPKETSPAWGDEAAARRNLFYAAWSHASVDDWVMWLDADMTPARDPRPLLAADVDAIAFRLFDLWTPTSYRSDEMWRGHTSPRVWAVKKRTTKISWKWDRADIHVGHLPTNYDITSAIVAPEDFSLLHYAYVAPELREAKYVAYAEVSEKLTEAERLHARSILDPEPSLVRLPFHPELTLL